ncbi:MAG: glycosyltransferase family 1 protein [Bryobacteraceae bacterium]|jgi:alpha-1,3-rhamnosyl/mannosyltransferase
MRIGIDATPLLLRSAGVKSYIYYWLASLRREAGERDAILTFPVPGRFGKLDHERSMAGFFRTAAGLAVLQGLNISRLPWAFPGLDVFHTSTHWRNPPRRAKLTTTIHDMTCWLMPELHSKANVTVTRRADANIAKRADGILADSESTRRDAIRILNLDPARIEVVYPGVPEPFFEVTAEDVHAVRARYGLERPYALSVGTVEPRKNIPGLLEAWDQLSATTREQYELVVAGPIGWADPATVAKVHSTHYLGYVGEADLPAITAGATVLVYPSLYEGFGLPVAQAMAAGTAVLTSNVSSLPEIAGDAALLVDPRSTAEIRDGLERLLTSPALRERLGGAGRVRARQFRWEIAARKSLEWFRRVAG